jgi:hypothetical protein
VTLAAIIAAASLVYLIGFGATYAMLERRIDEVQVLGAMFWPLVLPGMLGAAIVRRLREPKRAELPPARAVSP